MKGKAGNQNKFFRIITTPFRALGKAKDLYVRSMTSYANKVGYGTNYMGTNSTTYAAALPKSFSVNVTRSDDNEDLRELIRAASVRSMAESMDINHLVLEQELMRQRELLLRQQQQSRLGEPAEAAFVGMPTGMPQRSVSVGMARIDEEKPYASSAGGAGEDSDKSSKKKAWSMYPRSKSYAVNKRSPAAF